MGQSIQEQKDTWREKVEGLVVCCLSVGHNSSVVWFLVVSVCGVEHCEAMNLWDQSERVKWGLEVSFGVQERPPASIFTGRPHNFIHPVVGTRTIKRIKMSHTHTHTKSWTDLTMDGHRTFLLLSRSPTSKQDQQIKSLDVACHWWAAARFWSGQVHDI